MIVTTTLKTLVLKSEHITVCKDFKPVYVPVPTKDEPNMVQLQFEVVNAVDYTKEEIIAKYDLKTKVKKWFYGYTNDGEDSIIVVLADNK